MNAAREPIVTGFADPIEPEVTGDSVSWRSIPDVVTAVARTANVEESREGTLLTLRAKTELTIPFWRGLVGRFVKGSVEKGLEHMAEVIAARATGIPEPKTPRRPVWAPPDRIAPERASSIATVCVVLALTAYGGSLLTQTNDYVARTFGASDSDLSVVLALTRAGTLIGLIGSVLSDRRGRRLILIASTAALLLSSFLSTFAPNLALLTVLQVISRGCVNLAAVVGFISITEEASEGGRAYMLALAAVAGGAGFALGAVLLPVADIRPEAWRVLFALNALGLLLLPRISRNLPETQRYAEMAGRIAGARAREIVDATYGRRFIVVALTGFLINVFAAPTSQFMNRYLAEEHGYSGLGILILRFFTQGAPALVGVWIGGRVAESSGRKPVAARATILTAVTTALFFLTNGPLLWPTLLLSTVTGALSGPSLAAFNTELFPTEVRGRAGGYLLVIAVAGSVAGLLLAGGLAEPMGSLGAAVALTAIAPLFVALLLVPLLPEARGRLLDEVSPPEV